QVERLLRLTPNTLLSLIPNAQPLKLEPLHCISISCNVGILKFYMQFLISHLGKDAAIASLAKQACMHNAPESKSFLLKTCIDALKNGDSTTVEKIVFDRAHYREQRRIKKSPE